MVREEQNTHIERVPFPVAEVQVGLAQQIGGVFPTGATTRRARRMHKVGILTTLACDKKRNTHTREKKAVMGKRRKRVAENVRS